MNIYVYYLYFMRLLELSKIEKLYFGYEEIARILGISSESARVSASRYARMGLLIRLKNNLYVTRERWNAADREDKYLLANMVQTPSYISLSTALDYYEITTQMQRDYFESVAVKRTKEIQVDGNVFRYTKINENLYSGFKKEKGFFIATPEKALLDAVYLLSYGRYAMDLSAVDADKLDRKEIVRLCRQFPSRTEKVLRKYGYL